MSMSVLKNLVHEIGVSLNNQTFSQPFTASPLYVPDYQLVDLTTLRVVVVPQTQSGERASRNESEFTNTINVAVLKKLGDDMEYEIAGLIDLVQEIMNHLFWTQLPSGAPVKIENAPIYSPEFVRDSRTFFGVLSITYVSAVSRP